MKRKNIISSVMKGILAGIVLSGFLLFPGEEQGIQGASGPAQEYLILFKKEFKASPASVQAANASRVEAKGGEVRQAYAHIPAVAASLTAGEVKALEEDSRVLAVEKNIPFTPSAQTLDWGMTATGAVTGFDAGYKGQGVKIGIIDSGIGPHADLAVAGGMNFALTPTYREDNLDDHIGHGTHVAGIAGALDNAIGVRGVAPEVSLYALKIFDKEGATEYGGNLTEVLAALDWAIANDLDILNMSFGSTTGSTVLEAAINEVAAAGILMVAATGNFSQAGEPTWVQYPARYEAVVAVASVDQSLARSSFSCYGPEVDIAAPGGKIYSTLPNNQYGVGDGTSMAAPYVTGLLAQYKNQYPDASPAYLKKLLTTSAIELGTPFLDHYYGYGLAQWKTDYSGIYEIRSKNSQLVMDVYGGGRENATNIIQWPRHGGLNQQWSVVQTGDGYYTVTSVLNPQFSVDVYGGGTSIGNRVIQYWSRPWQINQKWRLVRMPDGTVSFMSQLSEVSKTYYLLDVYGGGKTAGVNVIQWTGHYGDNQRWFLDPVR